MINWIIEFSAAHRALIVILVVRRLAIPYTLGLVVAGLLISIAGLLPEERLTPWRICSPRETASIGASLRWKHGARECGAVPSSV